MWCDEKKRERKWEEMEKNEMLKENRHRKRGVTENNVRRGILLFSMFSASIFAILSSMFLLDFNHFLLFVFGASSKYHL